MVWYVRYLPFSERTVGLLERPYNILQQWGKHKDDVKFYLRYPQPPGEETKAGQTEGEKQETVEDGTDGLFCLINILYFWSSYTNIEELLLSPWDQRWCHTSTLLHSECNRVKVLWQSFFFYFVMGKALSGELLCTLPHNCNGVFMSNSPYTLGFLIITSVYSNRFSSSSSLGANLDHFWLTNGTLQYLKVGFTLLPFNFFCQIGLFAPPPPPTPPPSLPPHPFKGVYATKTGAKKKKRMKRKRKLIKLVSNNLIWVLSHFILNILFCHVYRKSPFSI